MSKLISLFSVLAVLVLLSAPIFAADTNRADQSKLQQFLAQPDRFSDIYKTEVYSSDNHRVGKFQDFIVDHSGKISYLILELGGLLKFGEKMFPVPWDFVAQNAKFDPQKKSFILNMTRDKLVNAPSFEQKDMPHFASGEFGKKVNDYFSSQSMTSKK